MKDKLKPCECGGKAIHRYCIYPNGDYSLEHIDIVMCENFKTDIYGNITGCKNYIENRENGLYGNEGVSIQEWNRRMNYADNR